MILTNQKLQPGLYYSREPLEPARSAFRKLIVKLLTASREDSDLPVEVREKHRGNRC